METVHFSVVLLHCNTIQGRLDVVHIVTVFAAAPEPPTSVSVDDGADCYTSVVSWIAPQPVCNVVIGNYSVRYQLRNGTGDYTTVYSPGTSVTLQDIVPDNEYTVSVAAISPTNELGTYTETYQFELQGDLCMFKCCVSQ